MSEGLRAGSAFSVYRINYSAFDQDAAHIEHRYAELARMADKPLPAPRLPSSLPGGPAAPSSPDSAPQLQREADAALRLAQSRANLARAEGDETRALAILNSALGQNAHASERVSLAVQTQAARIEHGTGGLQRFGQVAGQLGGQIGGLAGQIGNLAGSLGTIGAVGAVVGLGRTALELAQTGAQAQRTRGAFDDLATQAHTTGSALITALRSASHGEINDLNLELAANRANLLGVADSATEFSLMMEIARDRAQKMGLSTGQAFDNLVTGLGRASPLILDNLGITVSAETANENYARSIGKTAAALTEAEKKQALINEVLAQGRASLAATGGAADDAAGKFDRAQASIDNAKAAVGGLLALKIAPWAEDISRVTNALIGLGDAGAGFQGFAHMNAQVNPLLNNLQLLGSGIESATRGLTGIPLDLAAPVNAAVESYQNLGSLATQAAGGIDAAAQAARGQADAALAAASGMAYQSRAMIDAANAADLHRAIMLDDRQENIQAYEAALGFASAAGQSAVQSLIDADAKQAQAEQIRILQEQANEATNSFLTLNPTIDAAGIAALIAAGKLDPLIGQLAAVRIEAAKTANQMIQLNSTLGGGIGAGAKPLGRLDHGGGGALSADAIGERIRNMDQTERIYAHFSGVETGARTRSRATGAGHLSDMQQLNNSLLANQSSYEQKAQDLERQHGENLLRIERDFQTKSLAQQSQNEEKKREGRYQFYKSLADAGKDLGDAEAQGYSAAYEQAFAESQKLAQDGQHKLAADRLALRQQQIQQDIEAAKAIAAAEAEGDTKRADSLKALEALRKDSQAEELKQLEGRGDALVQDRQRAIDDEATRYQGAQDSNAIAAERKADRAVTAAEREQKAIGDTNALLAEQQRLYGQTSPRGSGAATATPAASIPATGLPAGAAAAAGAFAVFDAAVVSAIESQTTTLGGKLDLLIGRVDAVERAVRASKAPGSVQ